MRRPCAGYTPVLGARLSWRQRLKPLSISSGSRSNTGQLNSEKACHRSSGRKWMVAGIDRMILPFTTSTSPSRSSERMSIISTPSLLVSFTRPRTPSSTDHSVEIHPQIFQYHVRRVAARPAGHAAARMRARPAQVEFGHRGLVLPPARNGTIAAELPAIQADMTDVGMLHRVVVSLEIDGGQKMVAEDIIVGHVGRDLAQVLDKALVHLLADFVPLLRAAVLQVVGLEGIQMQRSLAGGHTRRIG